MNKDLQVEIWNELSGNKLLLVPVYMQLVDDKKK